LQNVFNSLLKACLILVLQLVGVLREVDRNKVVEAVKLLIEGLGFDVNDEDFRGTPERIARMYEEFLNACGEELSPKLFVQHADLVIVGDIDVVSFCPHHLMPWFGKAWIAYIPSTSGVLGLSKIVQAVCKATHKFTLQERASEEIADTIEKLAQTKDVLVVLEAEHTCMKVVDGAPNARIVTVATRGKFRENTSLAVEVFNIMQVLRSRKQ